MGSHPLPVVYGNHLHAKTLTSVGGADYIPTCILRRDVLDVLVSYRTSHVTVLQPSCRNQVIDTLSTPISYHRCFDAVGYV